MADGKNSDPNVDPSYTPPAPTTGTSSPTGGASKPMSTDDLLKIVSWASEQATTLAQQPHRELVTVTDPITGKQSQQYQDNGVGGQFNDVLALGTLALSQLQHGTVSASAAAQIGQANASLAESARQFDQNYKRQTGRDTILDEQWGKTFKQSQDILNENKRSTNLKSTLDLLQQEIAVGTLDANEATTRVQAATNAANVQRNVLADWGGRALPAGTEYFPGSEPGGALATAAAAIGQSFPGFKTQGTFGVDPAALGSTITSAQGPSVVPQARDALAAAAAALAGMGVTR